MLTRRGDTLINTAQIVLATISRTHPVVTMQIVLRDEHDRSFHGDDAWAWWLALELCLPNADNLEYLRAARCGDQSPTRHRPETIEWQEWREAEPYTPENAAARAVPVYAITRCHACGAELAPAAMVRTEHDYED